MIRFWFSDASNLFLECLCFLEEVFEAVYVYMSIDFAALYYESDTCKHVCYCVGYVFGSIQFSYDSFNIYKYLVTNSVIRTYPLLIFS